MKYATRTPAYCLVMSQISVVLTPGNMLTCYFREKFIDEQLRKRLGKKRDSEAVEEDKDGNAEEDDLYIIPVNLQVCSCAWIVSAAVIIVGKCKICDRVRIH